MAFEFIDLDRRGPVGWYRFNRPPRNAVPMEMLSELTPAFEALIADPDVRVIVLASAVDGYFSTGADIATFRAASTAQMSEWTDTSHNLARTIRASSKPVLAAISGVAVGGGLEMTFHADLRFAASDARLGQPEVNIGFIPPVGGTQGLVRLVGRARAFRMLYGGELLDAAAALRIGLVDTVVTPDELASEVQAYGEMLATKPANTLASIRRCLIDGGERSFDDGLEIEAREALPSPSMKTSAKASPPFWTSESRAGPGPNDVDQDQSRRKTASCPDLRATGGRPYETHVLAHRDRIAGAGIGCGALPC